MKTHFLLVGILALFACGRISADELRKLVPRAEYTARDAEIAALRTTLIASNPQKFSALEHRSASGTVMPYRLFKPALPSADAKLPLVLVLHGSSGRGTDNLAHITGGNACVSTGIWTLAENQAARPCFVLAPQCPPDPAEWTATSDWTGTSHPHREVPAPALAMVIELLDDIVKTQPVDLSRIYVVGPSMGGYGTWDLIVRQPERFAGAVPSCGGLADGQAKRIAAIPIWIFHGGADEAVPVKFSRDAFAELTASGGTPRYTEYGDGPHHISVYAWTEPGMMAWLFAQKRR
jgi:predicted peptidase